MTPWVNCSQNAGKLWFKSANVRSYFAGKLLSADFLTEVSVYSFSVD
jgi:hypothetical protein